MMDIDGRKYFGLFPDTPYGVVTDTIEDMEKMPKNGIRRIVERIREIEPALTSVRSRNVYTGGMIQSGIYDDGEFSFSTEYFEYLKAGKVGVPDEYKEYVAKFSEMW